MPISRLHNKIIQKQVTTLDSNLCKIELKNVLDQFPLLMLSIFNFKSLLLFACPQVFTKDLQKEKNWEIMEKMMQVYSREPEPI